MPFQKSSNNMEDRISQLEELVRSLRSKLSSLKPPGKEAEDRFNPLDPKEPTQALNQDEQAMTGCPEHFQPRLADMFGRISLENDETSYVSAAHWTAILDSIAELRNLFEDDEGSSFPDLELEMRQPPTEKPALLFLSHKYASKHDILSSVPSRPIVDRLVSGYFSAMDMAPVVVHGPTFLKEYEAFWRNPLATPVMWIGMLFAMMCLATQSQSYQADEPKGLGMYHQSAQEIRHLVRLHQEKIVQCLVLGKYTKTAPYTIQTLLLYFTTEHFQSEDTQIGTWILLGVIIRIAMRLGYHCDASHSPGITPFQGEMRRRAWAILVQLDLMTSNQIGLPRMIKESECDTAEPRNLFDADFGEDVASLPVSRPDTDLTPMLYVIVKNRIMLMLGKVSDLTSSTRSISYADVMRMDALILEVRNAIPPSLQTRPLASSLLDSPEIVMQRLYLAQLLYKAQCILHRNHQIPAYSDSRYSYSRQSCINAALQILQIQSTLNQETQPGGRLYRSRWKVSSLVNHDFFLAATILCLDIDRGKTMMPSVNLGDSTTGRDKRDNVMQALHESYRILLQSSLSSREAQKAAQALKIMLGKGRCANAPKMTGDGCESSETPFLSTQIHSLSSNSNPQSVFDPLLHVHDNPAVILNQQPSASISTSMPISSFMDATSDSNLKESTDNFDWVRS